MSKEKTNQRLIDMIRVKYANQVGIKIGFNRFNQSEDEKKEELFDHIGSNSKMKD